MDSEHQSRLLSEAQDHANLKSKVDRLISLETTDEATTKLRTQVPTRSGAIKSQYKKAQKQFTRPSENSTRGRPQNRAPVNQRRKCRGCSRTSHGNGKPLTREDCPANGKTCDSCGMQNHFAKVCGRRSTRASFAKMEDDTSGSDTDISDFSEMEDNEINADEGEYTTSSHFAARAQLQGFRHNHKPLGQR